MTKHTNATVTSTPAAIYLRMSTESQNYSNHHQRAAIAQYARENAMEIVREYADDGKSGLDIRRRAGLSQLISDVQAGAAVFKVIIVYDVSRWGRFQDVDEAAYHEHTCRRAGIAVVYCAEAFQNDGSPLASLLKSIKRTMAAEYSRELSSKVFGAQCRFIGLGYKQGGHAGYGLRRVSLAADGTPRRALQYGEAKGTLTDRVVFALGPADEIATVRRIYRLYIEQRASEPEIVRLLNREGIESEFGRPWTHCMIKSILTNVKYIGTLAYNRRSGKLSNPRERNLATEWVVKEGAIPTVVSKALFKKAQAERARRTRRYAPSELLDLLRDCYDRHGKVTAPIIAADVMLPDPQLFVRTFGSLVSAYDAAGLSRTSLNDFVDAKRTLRKLRQMLFNEVCALAKEAGALVEVGSSPWTLIINGKIATCVDVVPFRQPARGLPSWRICRKAEVDFVIAARHNHGTDNILDFFLLPKQAFSGRPIFIKTCTAVRFDSMRYLSVREMFFDGNV
ncbi:recombinase family protein [Massilia sp. S19_KUP03_FR1]|uniref:recombinase family protein n=1 Tax=Massilia sp. S19_KUP03_FR1 TaxID=3025503 RepID=UPI002FCD332F